jgi:hypothetical protein
MLIAYKSRRNSQWKTHSFVAECLPSCLSDIILNFLLPIHIDSDYEIAASGFYESISQISNVNSAMAGACAAGDIVLVKKMIDCGANDWNYGITEACRYQHREIGELMKANGAKHCAIHGWECDTFGTLTEIIIYNSSANVKLYMDGLNGLRYSGYLSQI